MIPQAAKKYIYYQEPGIVLLKGDCLEILPQLDPETIQCCVTSPPYWGLRDYGTDAQIGLEDSPESYTDRMSEVFAGVNKVLRPDGTLWLNLGDSYAANRGYQVPDMKHKDVGNYMGTSVPKGLKSKDLVGIPWRVAFALQADGWYLRKDIIEEVELYCPCGCGHVIEERVVRYSQDRTIIWNKPNPMPESVTDRPTTSHEYLFLMAKSEKYYYDHEAIKEPLKPESILRNQTGWNGNEDRGYVNGPQNHMSKYLGSDKAKNETHRNKRSVWTVTTKPYKGAHFAVFPPELIEPYILAGTKEGDIVIDPFSGSGTVGMVCKKHKRRYIGIELNEEYLKLSPDRIGAQEVLF